MCQKVAFPSIKWHVLFPNDIADQIANIGNGEGVSWKKATENFGKLVI